jgi:hypothetical protein
LKKSITLRGLGQPQDTILDGSGRTSVLVVAGGDVVCERLTIARGANKEGGGGVAVSDGKVVLRHVVLRDNLGDGVGGAALAVSRGQLLVEDSRIVENRGTHGVAALVLGNGKLLLKSTTIADNQAKPSVLHARDFGELVLEHVTVAKNTVEMAIEVDGTKIAAPTVRVSDSTLGGSVAVANTSRFPGQVTVARTQHEGDLKGPFTDGGGNHK